MPYKYEIVNGVNDNNIEDAMYMHCVSHNNHH